MLKRKESDLEYLSRRAMEESRAALDAACRRASSAHRHMAAAYAVKLRDEHLSPEDIAEMMASLRQGVDEDGYDIAIVDDDGDDIDLASDQAEAGAHD